MSRFLFVHGWGFAPDFWTPLIKALGNPDADRIDLGYFHSVIPAKAGIQKEPRLDSRFRGNDAEEVTAITHSFGTMWLLDHLPAQLDKLIVINGFARFSEQADYRPAVPGRYIAMMRQRFEADPVGTLKEFGKVCGATEPLPGPPDSARLARDLARLQDGDARPALNALAIPTLALAADDDVIVPPGMSRLAFANRLDTRLEWREGGHLLPRSNPAWCAERIRAFLK
jgi:pimeloyl-[acyl-carrier protein] methyl ester esterase